jgi:hypothetical protein
MDGQDAEIGNGDAIAESSIASVVEKEHVGIIVRCRGGQVGKVSILITRKDFLMTQNLVQTKLLEQVKRPIDRLGPRGHSKFDTVGIIVTGPDSFQDGRRSLKQPYVLRTTTI